ncbi:RIP metalloprotease RseP [Rhodoferax sp. TBRC 17198]|uniref:RIP metalloprotease RseP n=1 Tax=Rhodoferax potami TaxID=3068338 RepID=UPI0028BF1D62|nr:RIP metalloprotease RseP [Rhodoferax sp. TBRC 17198]MDT7522440.1 RIP metalloprotease RseP [Rhodoferax sp. TBRC 17198]
MQTIVAFLVAIGLLVAVHEWGHYIVARACGVKVLRFSIGFGPRLWSRVSSRSGTEFAVSLIPLGGYVKMLDEREAEVDPADRHQAFNTQSLSRRSAIVAAGPLVNLVFAVLLYSLLNWQATPAAAPVLPVPVTGSQAEMGGWTGGERVLRVGTSPDALEPVQTFDEFRWRLTSAALAQSTLFIETVPGQEKTSGSPVVRPLSFGQTSTNAADASMFQRIGWVSPFSKPVLGDVAPDSRAALAGLQFNDLVTSVNGTSIADASTLRTMIRSSPEKAMEWVVVRGSDSLSLSVTPALDRSGGQPIGRVGAFVGSIPEMVEVQYGFFEGISRAVKKTGDIAWMSLTTMGQMLTGQVSLTNLNGPLAIADYAGKSAALGFVSFVGFLALVSISLGVLNLLPLPVLDGGHLMYYLWEGVTGRPVPEKWWERLQRLGIALLLVMMSVALYNDIQHILG